MQLVKMPAASALVAEPPSTIYWRVSLGTFPPPIKQGPRAAAFIAEELEALNRARAVGSSTEEIKALVRKLVAERKGVDIASENTERKEAA